MLPVFVFNILFLQEKQVILLSHLFKDAADMLQGWRSLNAILLKFGTGGPKYGAERNHAKGISALRNLELYPSNGVTKSR